MALRILIVEDEPLIGLWLQMELQTIGYEVCAVVATGEEALASVAQDHPDVVILDAVLSGAMDGITVAQRINAQPEIAVIFITGHADDQTTRQIAELHPLGYLVKPIRVTALRALLEALNKSKTLGGVFEHAD